MSGQKTFSRRCFFNDLVIRLLIPPISCLTGCSGGGTTKRVTAISSSLGLKANPKPRRRKKKKKYRPPDLKEYSFVVSAELLNRLGGGSPSVLKVTRYILLKVRPASYRSLGNKQAVVAIMGLGAKNNLGWIYSINGKMPLQSVDQQTLAQGDEVTWRYVL